MKLRIEIGQYEFIEVDVDDIEKAGEVYRDVKKAFKSVDGLPEAEWRQALDSYLSEGNLSTASYEGMNHLQMNIIQELKRAFKRLDK